jgi:hypothetical protein
MDIAVRDHQIVITCVARHVYQITDLTIRSVLFTVNYEMQVRCREVALQLPHDRDSASRP